MDIHINAGQENMLHQVKCICTLVCILWLCSADLYTDELWRNSRDVHQKSQSHTTFSETQILTFSLLPRSN